MALPSPGGQGRGRRLGSLVPAGRLEPPVGVRQGLRRRGNLAVQADELPRADRAPRHDEHRGAGFQRPERGRARPLRSHEPRPQPDDPHHPHELLGGVGGHHRHDARAGAAARQRAGLGRRLFRQERRAVGDGSSAFAFRAPEFASQPRRIRPWPNRRRQSYANHLRFVPLFHFVLCADPARQPRLVPRSDDRRLLVADAARRPHGLRIRSDVHLHADLPAHGPGPPHPPRDATAARADPAGRPEGADPGADASLSSSLCGSRATPSCPASCARSWIRSGCARRTSSRRSGIGRRTI